MEFPQPVKKEARKRSGFKCCFCHQKPCDDVHHINPEAGDTLDNAAPLCAQCHELYGNNTKKRAMIKQARDWWFEHIEITYKSREEELKKLENIEDKVKDINSKTESLPLLEPVIKDIHNKVNIMYDSYQKRDYNQVADLVTSISGDVSTASSGTAIIDSGLLDSYGKEKESSEKFCPQCSNPYTDHILIDGLCPYCRYPLGFVKFKSK